MADPAAPRAALIARYKGFLRDHIDRRPSGLRGRLARALGKHKSFISQITNPAYRVPIPAGDLDTIFEVCRLSESEQQTFLDLYDAAHRRDRQAPAAAIVDDSPREVRIALPLFDDPATGRDVEEMIRDFALRTIKLAQRADRSTPVGTSSKGIPS